MKLLVLVLGRIAHRAIMQFQKLSADLIDQSKF